MTLLTNPIFDFHKVISSLRTADAFPVVASLPPIFRKERSDDQSDTSAVRRLGHKLSYDELNNTGAPNGSVHQNICSSGTFLLAGRCGKNSSPWKESVAGKKIIQGVRGDLKSRIAAMGYLYHSKSELCPMKLPSKSSCRL